jgi:hypothetical protein
MHILTGLLLSKLFAGSGKARKFKGFRGIIEIKHTIPGRIRFHIPLLKMDIAKGQLLEKQLLKAAAISQIHVNPLLGSVLIVYDVNKLDEVTLTGVLAKLLGLEKELEKAPKSLVGEEVSKVLKSANSSIYEQTDGLLDLNTTITITFLSLGIWSIIKGPSILPAGISLVYWAYNNSIKQLE